MTKGRSFVGAIYSLRICGTAGLTGGRVVSKRGTGGGGEGGGVGRHQSATAF